MNGTRAALLHAAHAASRPWLMLLASAALLELPSVLQPDHVGLAGVRIPGDALLLASLALWSRRARAPFHRIASALLALLAGLLICYRIDAALCLVLMRHAPVIYDQLFLARHLAVLLSDLWGGWAWLAGLAVLLVLSALTWLAYRLAHGFARGFERAPAPQRAIVLGGLWGALLLLSAPGGTAVRWSTPELVQNAIAARALAQRIAHGIDHSPYAGYDALALSRKPNVYVFFVESYGRVMATDPLLAGAWRDALAATEHGLGAAGFHFASAYSDAPVSGGRSWLAHASIFTGTHIDFEALFESLFARGRARVPHLPGFLRGHGYRTVLLAPADRVRAGTQLDNAYGYGETIRFSQLNYRGPAFGWGKVPDQYSLAYAQEHVFDRGAQPLFFVFTMVSSHATWNEVPERVPDPRDPAGYAAMKAQLRPASFTLASTGGGPLISQTRRYGRDLAPPSGAASAELRAAYGRSIAYDFELLRGALPALAGDDLILVLGDHQPPLIAGADDDFAAPVHVFARDPALLGEFLAHGFAPGLALPPHAAAALPHEALFSLIVRALLHAGGATRLPPYLPHGIALASSG